MTWPRTISDDLLPRTPAYREIWLDGEKVASGEDRKWSSRSTARRTCRGSSRSSVAVPPDNDVDIFAQDLGFIAILDDAGDLAGWNVTVGGGMGMTHGEPDTYPRTADVMASAAPRTRVAVAEAVVTVQRDWGDRASRKHARFKYTVEDRGLATVRAEVERAHRQAARRPAPLRLHGDRRPLRLGRGRGWPLAPDALHRERPRAGYSRRAVPDDGPAPHRRGA